jgi:hypothetical protein
VGHWTYECKGERKYVQRSSRTEILKRKLEGDQDKVAAKTKKEESGSWGKVEGHIGLMCCCHSLCICCMWT